LKNIAKILGESKNSNEHKRD